MSELRISADLTLPREAVTETFAILAKRGVGKTYTASVLVEEMLKAGLPVVVVDPIGVWWGLRASADGQSAGLPIVVITLAERKILTALAQYPAGRTKTQVAVLTGYAVNGGGFNNAVSALRSKGWAEGGKEQLRATDEGLTVLGPVEPLPSGSDLVTHWMGQLSKAERAALQVLLDAYPARLTKSDLAERAGYEANGGGFNNALSRLRTLELIEGRGEMRASESFFQEVSY